MAGTSRRTFLQAASLRASGLFLFSGLSSEAASATVFEKIKVVGLNVHNYRLTPYDDALTGRTTPAKTPEEMDALVALIVRLRPDVLGLSEMGDAASLAQLQERLKQAGCKLPYSELLEASDPARHLAILSKLPILSRQHVQVPTFQMAGEGYVMARGIFDVTLDAGNGFQLRLLGAHLKSRREMAEADQVEFRRNEARILRNHISSLLKAQPGLPLLLFGDFNDTRNSPALRELMQPRSPQEDLVTLELADTFGERWTYHYEPADEYSRIDYLFASPALLPKVDPSLSGLYSGKNWHQASDHRPLFVTLRPAELRPKKEK
jgi:endonuclease/exonuclease/phosphatase family metal-dependent hydrolase